MTFKIFGQILDKATLWTVLDGQLPNFLDIGRTLDRNFWKLAALVDAPNARVTRVIRALTKSMQVGQRAHVSAH